MSIDRSGIEKHTVAVVLELPVGWVAYLPLLPLAVLLPTGLYMFVLPYAAGRRGT